ncbi:YbaB/EbfC family DNA-binding protein [Mycolicibacterium sp. 050232]|uniref:YbaB/EbfC family DNA-binding protein n=1 Tax=Mycolicibacterium sp. 050232 TaxID=3113982 RepID=UPI002E28EE20|nr:YbaB/EbfC family DNA-binding protein [Mycolicibacterium sp. 050232]MED5816427.1 YbaB/EbfC family DNA-binding protein [Mycolicibacterium sp. 050232]
MSGSWEDSSWDDDEPNSFEDESSLDALDFTCPAEQPEDNSESAVPTPDADDDAVLAILFTVTNPPGTVSVSALASGQPAHIDLSPRVVDMTESQLTDEILVIARLAAQQALAGQNLILSSALERLGVDRTSIRNHLEHAAGLPSAEAVLAEKAQIFATRYRGDGDD